MKTIKKTKGQLLSQIIVLSTMFGFAAGAVGQIVADVYFDPWRDYLIDRQISQDQGSVAAIPELAPIKRVVGTQQDFEVVNSLEQISPSVVGVYSKKPVTTNVLRQLYLPDELLGSGIVLTSDGWLVTDASVVGGGINSFIVVHGTDHYLPEQIISDPMTGLVFVKIAAANLPVALLGDSDQNFAGQLVVATAATGDANVTYIQNPQTAKVASADDYVFSSEQYPYQAVLKASLDKRYIGAPVVNIAGEVVGLVSTIENTAAWAVPINQLRPVLLNVLRTGVATRPYFGVTYIDLANTVGHDQDQLFGYDRGALVFAAPLRNSPAGAAGIQINDIIISVDNQAIDKNNNLTQAIQQYKSGDQLSVEIVRDGQTMTQSVVLGELPE